MGVVADILLIAGALGAGFYCIVLSRRLSRFADLEKGVGGAIAVLSEQVEEMTRALSLAQNSATSSTTSLEGLTGRAEDVAKRLELLVASMHDLPEVGGGSAKRGPVETKEATQPGAPASPSPDVLFLSRRVRGQEAAE